VRRGARAGAPPVVGENPLRWRGPCAEPVDRETERLELAPDVRLGGGLEDPLVLEERQVEIETGRAPGTGPVDRGRASAGSVGDVVHGRRPQKPVRVVDRVAGQIFSAPRLTVEDVVRHDAVAIGAHPRHHARVRGPGGARAPAFHAPRHHAALGEATQRRHAYARVAPVEGGEPVETDQDDASHAAQSYESTPSLFSAATWSAPMPSQAFSTSALCWPRPG